MKDKIRSTFTNIIGYCPDDYEQFYILVDFYITDLKKLEQDAKNKHIKDFPNIFNNKDFDIVKRDIMEYVAQNLADYAKQNNVKMVSYDRVKVSYWIGMYIYEVCESYYGLKFFQADMVDRIFNESAKTLDKLMIRKMTNFVKEKNRDDFFRYYGRFGLYHAFKLADRTLCHY